MATISKRTNKSGTYYYMVESARVNGKPRIVKQVYLGTAERITKAVELLSSAVSVPDPQRVIVYDFGVVTALYSVAERLGICRIIDDIAGKRGQGLPISTYMILAAINRAVSPTSKNTFFEWFDKTVLYKVFPSANKKNLSSQGFWNNMASLDEDKIRRIEDEITKRIVKQYGINSECLLFDNTNFFTYIDTANPSKLAKRGHSKSVLFTDRDDWTNERIVGAYRLQYHVEEAFKQMKDTKYLSFRPIRHFTDNHIRVHTFYCVLALTLSGL